ncbi:hypothetical protein PRIPAC_92031 [Pristionchus pacificus]|uniref:HTH OST-type domain-containing protein n=1 Tax=Pristionchus pacificus TaxID=54126 RepID=A0A2A6CCQ0_PRIPA|nr:hypothetical protein PRIPAC_92031 [Pristionchus pacificus]|eukprot:PDM75974.1 hypothetical protein PRIPAC_37647 [Pristionchus pacificus]
MTEDISLRIIRTTIFSIVVPNKEPCSSYKIKMEYKDMEGEDIPFGDYGHRSLDDFLLAHPMLSGMQQEGKWVFTAKMSERSANIQALVKGQKGKKKKGKKGAFNHFARNSSRSSYHGRPTLGQGDVRRANGAQPFNRNNDTYRSFTSGAYRPPSSFTPMNANLSTSKNSVWGSQQLGSARAGPSGSWNSSSNAPSSTRPNQSWNQPRKTFTPILAPNRSFNTGPSSSTQQASPQEGMRRFNTILFKCKGSVTLRVFCRLYAQEFHVPFAADELKRHFNTVNLAEIINKYGNDKILVSPTPDESVMFTDSQVLEAHTRAARDLEEKKKNSVVIEPEKKHCTIPSVKVMFDEMTEMLVECFPEGIPLNEITSRYEEKAGVMVDPIRVFSFNWSELIEKKFNSRIKIDNGKAVLTPLYIKANNLQVRPTGERKKQELVTLSDLGIIFVDDSSQDDDEDEEEEEDSQSESTSHASSDLKNSKASWRPGPCGYESMSSSVSGSVQGLNASPRELNDGIISEEVDELSDRLMRTVKVEVDQESPRLEITISRSSPNTVHTLIRRNEVASLGAVEENSVVKTEETPATSSRNFFSKIANSFRNQSRSNANVPVSVSSTSVKEPRDRIKINPVGGLKLKASGAYTSFSITVDGMDEYAFTATCPSAYYRIYSTTSYTLLGSPKLLQVMREMGPTGPTPVKIDFVKKAKGETRNAAQVMADSTPDFTIEYIIHATN